MQQPRCRKQKSTHTFTIINPRSLNIANHDQSLPLWSSVHIYKYSNVYMKKTVMHGAVWQAQTTKRVFMPSRENHLSMIYRKKLSECQKYCIIILSALYSRSALVRARQIRAINEYNPSPLAYMLVSYKQFFIAPKNEQGKRLLQQVVSFISAPLINHFENILQFLKTFHNSHIEKIIHR